MKTTDFFIKRNKRLQVYLQNNRFRIKRYSLLVNDMMRRRVLVTLIFLVFQMGVMANDNTMANDSLRKQIFSFSPMSKHVGQVNGMVLGVGLFEDIQAKKINGLNIEVNPAILLFLMFEPDRIESNTMKLHQINGINISTCVLDNYSTNGINFSLLYNGFQSNGLSLVPLYNITNNSSGIHFTGLFSKTDIGKGLFVSILYSKVIDLNGVSLSIINHSEKIRGLQVGAFNKNEDEKGFQIGLWNINKKRSLPLINW